MKIRVSKKEIREGAGYIIGVPYCDLQYLLRAESSDYYKTAKKVHKLLLKFIEEVK